MPEALARAAGEAHRSAMIARQRAWWIGFVALCLAPFAIIADAPWLSVSCFTVSIGGLFRVNAMQARMDRAKATLAFLAADTPA